MKIDPICHMEVDETIALTTQWKGKRIYSCPALSKRQCAP